MKLSIDWLFNAPDRAPWRRRAALTFLVSIVFVRLWLAAGQVITAYGSAWHDDAHFMLQAIKLISGKWLGQYDYMTLIKGPFYSMWIATTFALGIPLLFAEHLLYVVSCGVFVWALSPTVRSTGVRLTLFTILLFCPTSLSEGVMSRLLRESISAPLTLLVLGTALGAVFRQERPFRLVLPWVLGLGASLAGFFLLREERIWLLPSLLIILAGALVRRLSAWRVTLRLAGIAVAVFAVLVGIVVIKNGVHYGAYVVTEMTEGPFMYAYGTLARVRHEVDRPHLPIPAETRQRIYEVSPKFAELAPYLEGHIRRGWAAAGCKEYRICDDIAAGWILWALREAAHNARYYKTGGDAARYWAEVAAEVDRACDDGRLACGPRGFSFLPPLRSVDIKAFGETLAKAIQLTASFDGIVFRANPSDGTAEEFAVFADVTRTRLAPDAKGIERKLWHQDGLLKRKETLLQWNHALYRTVNPLIACATLLAFGIAVVMAVSRRHLSGSLLTAGALLVAAATRAVLLSLVDSMCFPSLNAAYLTPTQALLAAFEIVALHAVFVAVKKVPENAYQTSGPA